MKYKVGEQVFYCVCGYDGRGYWALFTITGIRKEDEIYYDLRAPDGYETCSDGGGMKKLKELLV